MKQFMNLRMCALGLMLSAGTMIFAQDAPIFTPYYKYRVTLKDKKKSEYSVKHPEAFLSQRAIERRMKQKIKIDVTDLPVNRNYINEIAAMGVKIVETSKWNNTVVVSTEDTTVMDRVRELACVKGILKVATYTKPAKENPVDRHKLIAQKPENVTDAKAEDAQKPADDAEKVDTLILDPNVELDQSVTMRFVKFLNANNKKFHPERSVDSSQPAPEEPYSYYGAGKHQIEQLNGVPLHDAGYKGQGMVIGIIDGGFYNADIIPGLKSAKILGTHDFVNPTSDIYNQQDHGMMVLSCIGANEPGKMVGTAPEASFWLFRSEDGSSEQMIEEDNWAAAIEFADSVGVDVVNTSLGYNNFDDKVTSVKYYELDGHTQLISNSASMCAEKGMILVNSAGNSADEPWKLITSPADAENTLTVGAVGANGVNTNFSSLGNTIDGRIKPDVMALGGMASMHGADGNVTKASGTSFASPITCGMVTCLWQALPNLNAKQIMDLVRKAGNNASHPDNVYGYGIPDYEKAWKDGRNL
ncbi:MAG: S8 family serine peptidase [Bacteroidales bacterium]|nr:S8 family serine peptidase [Bacteroidales bacterium]